MKQKRTEKIDVMTEASPLQSLAFTALGNLDTSHLPQGAAGPSVEKPVAAGKKMPLRQRLILRREKKDRGGKTVVVISGFNGNPEALNDLARRLRKQLGCGGTVEQREIVIQGDQPSAVADSLRRMGHEPVGVVG